MSSSRKRVLVFGTFDLFHPGHRSFLRQAAGLGDYLCVVVARDRVVRRAKGKSPVESEIVRLASVLTHSDVNEACLGDKRLNSYNLLSKLDYDILVVGYDQTPANSVVKSLLQNIDRGNVEIVRLKALKPESYKTSRIRDTLGK